VGGKIVDTMHPSKSHIYKEIKACGVSKALVRKALPDWWNDELLSSKNGLFQFAHLLRRRFGIHTDFSAEDKVSFTLEKTSLQFKKRGGTPLERLKDSTFLSLAGSKAISRVLLGNQITQNISGLESKLLECEELSLKTVLELLWSCGLPVLYVDSYSSNTARPAAVVSKFNNFYAISLSHKHKSPSIQLFILLHEIGHILSGHLVEDGALTDITITELGEQLTDSSDAQESEADDFALRILRKGFDLEKALLELKPLERPGQLAIKAKELSQKYKINSGHFILSYGRRTSNWILTHQALRFIEKKEAQSILKNTFSNEIGKLEVKDDDLSFLMKLQKIGAN